MTEIYFLGRSTISTTELDCILIKELTLLCSLAPNSLLKSLKLLVRLLQLHILIVLLVKLYSEKEVI